MSASGKNMERICQAKEAHDRTCVGTAYAVHIHPLELERLGWEGDALCGMTVEADTTLGTGSFRLVCDREDTHERATTEQREVVHV